MDTAHVYLAAPSSHARLRYLCPLHTFTLCPCKLLHVHPCPLHTSTLAPFIRPPLPFLPRPPLPFLHVHPCPFYTSTLALVTRPHLPSLHVYSCPLHRRLEEMRYPPMSLVSNVKRWVFGRTAYRVDYDLLYATDNNLHCFRVAQLETSSQFVGRESLLLETVLIQTERPKIEIRGFSRLRLWHFACARMLANDTRSCVAYYYLLLGYVSGMPRRSLMLLREWLLPRRSLIY